MEVSIIDVIKSEELVKKYYKIDHSKLARIIVNDLDNKNLTGSMLKNFSKDKVLKAIQSPEKNQQLLRDLSIFFFHSSLNYKRLVYYFAQMLTFDWYIDPYKLNIEKANEKMFKKKYFETLDKLDTMHIRHEMTKCMSYVVRDGIFYGYEHSLEDSYFIKPLDPNYCKISSIIDGVYGFKFNLQIFDKYPNLVSNYGEEFQTAYKNYKSSKNNEKDSNWYELSSEKSICIKSDETITYPVPPFIGVFSDIYEIAEYKSLKKASTEMQNYSFLVGQIPFNKTEVANDFKLELDTAIEFGNKISESLPDQVGFLLSVFEKMDLIKVNPETNPSDKVDEATNSYWSTAGVSKNLFNDSGNTDASMKYSIMTDENFLFEILRQIERWYNRKITTMDKTYRFKINFLDVTRFTKKELIEQLLKSCQFGLPNKIKLHVALGNSQSSVTNMLFLENDILRLHETFIPLQSSHTNSGDVDSPTNGANGRPSVEQGGGDK